MGDIKSFAETLKAGRIAQEEEYGRPVDDFELTLGLDVFAKWVKGFKGNSLEPGEPAGYEISKVMCRGIDITNLLSEEDLERLQNELCD